jgi:GAF domain-containing protein
MVKASQPTEILGSDSGNEPSRLAALKEYHVLDATVEKLYDGITELAAHVCSVPLAVICLKDDSRKGFKPKVVVGRNRPGSCKSYCSQMISSRVPLIVRDALKDKRFVNCNLVTRPPRIRFYAGFPLMDSDDVAMGMLCVMDTRTRRLTTTQRHVMQALARKVGVLLELRRLSAHLADALEHVKMLSGLIPICAWCKRIRDDDGYWSQIEAYFHAHADADFTHSICPKCLKKERTRLSRLRRADGSK